ncbi:MAG: SusC/RagA family TonB-linked outer membrane protein [Ferruginibacter sp.]
MNPEKINMAFYAALKRIVRSSSGGLLVLLLLILAPDFIFAQQKTITGRVTNEGGLPVAASVTIKGTNTGVATDENGNFSLQATSGAKIVISSAEYTLQELTVGNGNTLNATLQRADRALGEVVVVGYGTQKKIDVTGSVARVNLEAMGNAPNTNIGQFLQGTIPGLNVGVSTFAGGTPPISIRGQVTLSGTQNVLIILDGIQYTGSLSSINPDDISSIDVLKDASSTAVYGAQAANGVILITSRKGRAGQKTRMAFSSAYSTLTPSVDLKPLNREGFLQGIKDAFWSEAYLGPDYAQPNPAFDVTSKLDGSMRPGGVMLPNDYDWWGNATKTGSILENNLSISGGSDKVSYLLSGGLVNQKGFIINDIFKRKSIRINLETRPFNWWKVGVQSSGSFVDQDGAEPSMGIINITSPLLVPYDVNGNLIPSPTNTVVGNPFLTYDVTDRDRHQYYFANFYSDIDVPFIKGLNYRINFGNNFQTDQHYFASKYGAGITGQAYKENRDYYDYTFDNILTYTKKIGRHDISATALYGAIERKFSGTFAEGSGFDRISLGYNNIQSATIRNISTNAWSEALNYQMGRLNYKYNDKYLLTATIRRDGFSGFAANYKYATFPSVGLGWILSKEKFMQNVELFNLLKLRLTYGLSGNLTKRYYSLSQVSGNSSYVFGDGAGTAFGQQVNTLSNPNLKWERTKGLNLGVDFTMLSNRLTGSLDYYNNNTHELLFNVTIPSITGFNIISSNIGEIHNTGFEGAFTYQIIRKKDLNWSATFNFWKNTNEIVHLTGVDADGDGKEDDLTSSGLFIGKSIQSIFDYKAGTIYQLADTRLPGFQVGSLSVFDGDKNNVINSSDRLFLGRQEPAYRMSLYNNISYKEFSLSFFLNSVQGGKDGYLGNNSRLNYRDDNNIRNNDLNAVNYWSPRTPNAKYPRIISGNHSTVEPNLWESRSFVRLQDISLSYALPASILKKIKADAINFYISGKNLVTWTNWDGWDPEGLNSDGVVQGLILNARPVLKGITVGLHITY